MRRPSAPLIGLVLLVVLVVALLLVWAQLGDLDRGPGIEGLRAGTLPPAR